jgi:hypothetical protein
MTTLAFIMFDGAGGSVGGWTSGRLYQALGGSATYRIFGLASLAAAGLTALLQARHCTALHCTALHCTARHGTARHCTC